MRQRRQICLVYINTRMIQRVLTEPIGLVGRKRKVKEHSHHCSGRMRTPMDGYEQKVGDLAG